MGYTFSDSVGPTDQSYAPTINIIYCAFTLFLQTSVIIFQKKSYSRLILSGAAHRSTFERKLTAAIVGECIGI